MTIKCYLPDHDVNATVNFNLIKGSRGACDRYGCPLEPDTDDEIEITSCEDENGAEILFTEDEENLIIDLAFRHIVDRNDQAEDYDFEED